MKIAIVGGVAGGASAAARARRLSEDAEIILFERGPAPSFANCGLPYYVGGIIPNRRQLLVAPEPLLVGRFRLDVRTRQSVESIDRQNKTLTVKKLEDGSEYTETYDKLILSPGAAPIVPPIPGANLPGVYALRNLEDADRLHEIVTGEAKRAVVVGAGFIGLELAENLVQRDIETTVVELAAQILPAWDREMTVPIASHLEMEGVRLLLSNSAERIDSSDNGLIVHTKSGQTLDADLVIMAVGVRPENRLATDAGLAVGVRGGIQVSEHMQTADPDIYAVGDAVEVTSFMTGEPIQIPLAGPANRQGRIAADHIFGRDSRYRGTQGTAIVGVFDQTAAMTGLTEKTLKAMNRRYEKVYIHPASHAGYYPGAERMTLKLLFEPDSGRILGAQAVGGEGVDKRIDVLATAIQAGMTVFDLEEVELAYAPQYGSAKDPINMAGFVAAGVVRGDQPVAQVDALDKLRKENAFILDVRNPPELARGAIPDAANIPLDELRDRLDEIPKDRPIVVSCQVGLRGYLGTRILLQNGFDARNLSGGYTTYSQFNG